MMSSDRVFFMYLSCIHGGIPNHITISAIDALLLVFNFSESRFGQKLC